MLSSFNKIVLEKRTQCKNLVLKTSKLERYKAQWKSLEINWKYVLKSLRRWSRKSKKKYKKIILKSSKWKLFFYSQKERNFLFFSDSKKSHNNYKHTQARNEDTMTWEVNEQESIKKERKREKNGICSAVYVTLVYFCPYFQSSENNKKNMKNLLTNVLERERSALFRHECEWNGASYAWQSCHSTYRQQHSTYRREREEGKGKAKQQNGSTSCHVDYSWNIRLYTSFL